MLACYAKWLSTCSGNCKFNGTWFMCVEWNCHYVFLSVVVFLLAAVLFACATILRGE